MSKDPEPTKIDATELLIRKYTLLKQEAIVVTGFYKGHIRNFQILAGVIVSATGLISAGFKSVGNITIPLPSEANWLIWSISATILWVVVQYWAFDILDSLYHLVLLGQRLSILEDCINTAYGKRWLIWEKDIVPIYWEWRMPCKGVINPNWVSGCLGIPLLWFTAVFPSSYIYYKIWSVSNHWEGECAVIFGFLASVGSSVIMVIVAFKILLRMRGRVREDFTRMLNEPLE